MIEAYTEYNGPDYFCQLDPCTVKVLDETLINKAFEIADEFGECFISHFYTSQFWEMYERTLLNNVIIRNGKIYTFETTGFGDYKSYADYRLAPVDKETVDKLKDILKRIQ